MVGERSEHRLYGILERFARVRVDSRGRISLPKRFMDRLGVATGDDLYIKITPSKLEIYTTKTLDEATE